MNVYSEAIGVIDIVNVVFIGSKQGRWRSQTVTSHFIHVTILVREEYTDPIKGPVYRYSTFFHIGFSPIL